MAINPIMSTDQERFMAFDGLVQWTQAVVTQSARVLAAKDQQVSSEVMLNSVMRRQAVMAFHSECHFFVIATHKVIEYRDWVVSFGLCASVDFGEIDQFSTKDIKIYATCANTLWDILKEKGIVRCDGSPRHQITKRTPVRLLEP